MDPDAPKIIRDLSLDYDAIELSVQKTLSFKERDRVRMGLSPAESRGVASRGIH